MAIKKTNEVGEFAVTNLDATTGVLVSGIKDNVQLFENVGRTTIGTVTSAVDRIASAPLGNTAQAANGASVSGIANGLANGTGAPLPAGVAGRPGAPPPPPPPGPPPLRSFEAWLDEYGGGSVPLQVTLPAPHLPASRLLSHHHPRISPPLKC